MGGEAKATVGEIRDALARGISQRKLAHALGKAEARVSEWLRRDLAAPSGVTREQLARAVAVLTGAPDPGPLDLIALTSGPLAHVEDLANQILAAVQDARARLNGAALAAPTPSDSAHADRLETEAREAQDAAGQAPPAPVRVSRRKGGGHR